MALLKCLKITLLDHQNNYVERLSIDDNTEMQGIESYFLKVTS